jgi:hypothetical protein
MFNPNVPSGPVGTLYLLEPKYNLRHRPVGAEYWIFTANTYTQLHIQFVFAVKYRMCLIQPSWEDELYKYITGIVQNHKHKMLAVNGMSTPSPGKTSNCSKPPYGHSP